MKLDVMTSLFVAAGLTLSACETGLTNVLDKNAQGDELRKETRVGVTLPAGCPTHTLSLPAGRSGLTISYQEPTTNQNGNPLNDLAYTTVYVSSSKTPHQAIRVWTNYAQGGALVTIRDIAARGEDIGICITATNLSGKESGPAPTRVPESPSSHRDQKSHN